MDLSPGTMAAVEIDSMDSLTKINKESGVTLERAQGRRSLAGIVYRPPIDAATGHYKYPPPPGPPDARILRSIGSDFRKKSTNVVLEVLLEEPRVNIRNRVRKSSRVAYDSTGQLVGLDSPSLRQHPKRIRLRSPNLFKFFGSIPASAGNSFNMPGATSVVRRL